MPLSPPCTLLALPTHSALPAVQAAAARGAGSGRVHPEGLTGEGEAARDFGVQDPEGVQGRLGCMARLWCRSIWDVGLTWTSGTGGQFRPVEATLGAPSPGSGL